MTVKVAAIASAVLSAWAVWEGLAWLAAWFSFGSGMFWGMSVGEKYLREGLKLVKQLEVELERERQSKRGD